LAPDAIKRSGVFFVAAKRINVRSVLVRKSVFTLSISAQSLNRNHGDSSTYCSKTKNIYGMKTAK
jgi:hypothetical protein